MKPNEAVMRILSFVEAASEEYQRGERPDIEEAFVLLDKLTRDYESGEIDDIEWGEPGSCRDRVSDDEDIFREVGNGLTPDEFDAEVKRLGLGRHQGNPHCIWCLQGS